MVRDIELPSTSPSSKQRRDTQIYSPLPRPLLQPGHREPHLSSSEPTLRFPLPQGDQNLAHWISSSNPDIMHLASVSVEDAGLTESTYELIGGTDTESQDGNYLDNISESVGSLDMHRPDDVISLAGTENTCDEESVADVTEDHHDHHEQHGINEYELSREPDLSHFQFQHASAAENSDDDDNSSKASLEYADNSLRTPSILTPEASRYLVKQDEIAKKNLLTRGLLWMHEVLGFFDEMCLSALPVLVAFLAVAIVTQTFVPSAKTDSESAVSGIAAVSTLTPSTRSQHQNTVTISSPTSGVALIPLTSSPDEGLFRLRKPTVSFTPHGKNDVLIHVSQEVRDTWMTSKCLDVSVLRSTQELEFSLSAVDDGILVKFPRREAYGVVNLSIKSKCRPKTEKAIKVHFGKGIIVDAFERTKSLAQDLSELVPVAVYEAERCLAGAKRVFESASDSFSHAWLVGTERAQDLLISANFGTSGHLANSVSGLWRQAVKFIHSNTEIPQKYSKYAHSVRTVQAQLRLGLLDAQISARMWWLKVQGKDEEYQMYASMAQAYLQQKKAAAKELLQKLQSRAKTTA